MVKKKKGYVLQVLRDLKKGCSDENPLNIHSKATILAALK